MNDNAGVINDSNLGNEFDYLDWEILLGMRAQSMGRDQNEFVHKMRALPSCSVMAYLETDFVLSLDKEECVLRVRDEIPKQLANYLESEPAASWTIVSAYNPYSQELPTEENQHRHRLLQEVLTTSRHKYYPAVGRSAAGDWEEPSLLVFDLSYAMAAAIGAAFQQNAVVFGERGAVVEMIFCDK